MEEQCVLLVMLAGCGPLFMHWKNGVVSQLDSVTDVPTASLSNPALGILNRDEAVESVEESLGWVAHLMQTCLMLPRLMKILIWALMWR